MDQHDILIINQSEALTTTNIDALQRKGFSVSVASELEEVSPLLTSLHKPILLINCSASEHLEPFVEKLCRQKDLHPYPIVILAKILVGLESRLNRIYPLAIALQHPADTSKIVEAVRFVNRNYKDKLTQLEHEADDQSDFEEIDENQFNSGTVTDEILSANELFSAVKEWNLAQVDLGGADLPLLLSGFKRDTTLTPILPSQENFRISCESFLSSLKPQTRISVERVNIIALKIAGPLGLENDLLEYTKAASILFAQAFAAQNRSLLSREYSFKGAIVLRKEICSAIKDSALNIGGELADRELSAVISSVGKIIGQEDNSNQARVAVAASSIVAADLVNRSCYHVGIWNSSAAYKLLRKFRQGRVKGLHPAVVCTLLKLLAEALSSPTNQKLMGSNKSDQQLAEAEKSLLVNEEALVELPALTAGMRLSRPLETEDGRAILEEDLVLDDDLIMRIWQLSSIRLINKAVVKRIH